MSKERLSNEQDGFIESALAKPRGTTVLDAGAGTGKTHTMIAYAKIAHSRDGKKTTMFYFGADNAAEGKRRVDDRICSSSTLHSRAYRSVSKDLTSKLGRQFASAYNKALGCSFDVAMRGIKIINYYCQSDSEHIGLAHLPPYTGISPRENEDLNRRALAVAPDMFEMMISSDDKYYDCKINPDVYFKVWALKNPQIETDRIIIDEYQDNNACVWGIFANQKHNPKIVLVGDVNQGIYSWRGAINGADYLDIQPDDRYQLTHSFRNPQIVSELTSDFLNKYKPRGDGKEWRFTGVRGWARFLEIKNPACILCRTNGGAIANALRCVANGQKALIKGGVANLIKLIKGVGDLINKGRSYYDFLIDFKSYGELIDYSETEIGSDLKPMIKAIADFGIDRLIDIIKKCQNVRNPDVIIATVHTSKGMEYANIKLASDNNPRLGDDGQMEMEDVHVLYTAITRTKGDADFSEIDILNELI